MEKVEGGKYSGKKEKKGERKESQGPATRPIVLEVKKWPYLYLCTMWKTITQNVQRRIVSNNPSKMGKGKV